MPDSTPLPSQSPPSALQAPQPQRRPWLLWGCGGLIGLLILIAATVAITLWWIQRPIKPVVLSADEKKVVETKLEQMHRPPVASADDRPASVQRINPSPDSAPARLYQPGGKEFRLTERELNGLLNENTDLGQTVRLEFDTDAINAYLAVPIPQDFPVGGGRIFRARGRFRMAVNEGQAPVAMLEDLTVFGLSLPKEWLGGIKGKNFLADAFGEKKDAPRLKGIKSIRIVPGAIVMEVGD